MDNINYDQENNLLGDYFFKISYPKQNYKELKEYQNWKKTVTDKFGNNGKEILCNEDNTIIYIIHNNNDEIIKCPTCNTDLYNCIYCNITQTEKCHICCLRAYLKYIFKANYETCVHKLNQDEDIDFNVLLIKHFIPIFSSLLFTFTMFGLFCMNLGKKNIPFYESIEEKKKHYFILIYLFIFLFLFIMAINYAIFYFLIFLCLFIVSLPFKLYFVKLYVCIIDAINDE